MFHCYLVFCFIYVFLCSWRNPVLSFAFALTAWQLQFAACAVFVMCMGQIGVHHVPIQKNRDFVEVVMEG